MLSAFSGRVNCLPQQDLALHFCLLRNTNPSFSLKVHEVKHSQYLQEENEGKSTFRTT